MKSKNFVILTIILMLCSEAVYSKVEKFSFNNTQDTARTNLKNGQYEKAIELYNEMAKGSQHPLLLGEYAFALALGGQIPLALSNLDRIIILDKTDPKGKMFLAKVFEIIGLTEESQELMPPSVDWINEIKFKKQILKKSSKVMPLNKALHKVNTLLGTQRFASALYLARQMLQIYPNDALLWSTLAICQEKIGAFKAASYSVQKDIALRNKELNEDELYILETHASELKSRNPLIPIKPNEMLKGRYLAYLGGGFNRINDDSIVNINTRFGKFLTNRINSNINLGYVTDLDLVLALEGRYHQPLKLQLPINATVGMKIDYISGNDDKKFGLMASPGLSYFFDFSSIDLIVDVPISGPKEGTQTLSIGYSIYFDMPNKLGRLLR